MHIEILKDFISTNIGSRRKGEIIKDCPDYYAKLLIEDGLAAEHKPKKKTAKK